jgi:hypothetical protein
MDKSIVTHAMYNAVHNTHPSIQMDDSLPHQCVLLLVDGVSYVYASNPVPSLDSQGPPSLLPTRSSDPLGVALVGPIHKVFQVLQTLL